MDGITDRIRKGDREAFNTLCRERYASLIAYARVFLDDASAQDVVQDVLFSVWQRRETLWEGSDLTPFLMRSVYNRCMGVIAHSRRLQKFGDRYRERIDSMLAVHLAPDSNPVLAKLCNAELGRTIEDAIAELPPRCAEIFRLRYIEHMTGREISERLGISVSTVENQVNIALRRLRPLLEGQR